MIALNASVADQLNMFADKVEKEVLAGKTREQAILDEIRVLIAQSKPIHFDGNGYSDEWKEEAVRRGLDTEICPPLMYDAYLAPSSVEMFARAGVFDKLELEARNEVKWEMYTKKIQIEARVLGDLAINHILPAATRYESTLLDNVDKIMRLFAKDEGAQIAEPELKSIREIASHKVHIRTEVDAMIEERKVANRIESEREKAIAYHNTVLPRMQKIRYHIDKLELMVDNEIWPLPKYRELLFIR